MFQLSFVFSFSFTFLISTQPKKKMKNTQAVNPRAPPVVQALVTCIATSIQASHFPSPQLVSGLLLFVLQVIQSKQHHLLSQSDVCVIIDGITSGLDVVPNASVPTQVAWRHLLQCLGSIMQRSRALHIALFPHTFHHHHQPPPPISLPQPPKRCRKR